MTYQTEFGGGWTQRKLEVLRKYLQAYTKIFKRNPRASFYSISYVDAFAGTGTLAKARSWCTRQTASGTTRERERIP